MQDLVKQRISLDTALNTKKRSVTLSAIMHTFCELNGVNDESINGFNITRPTW